MRFSQNILSKIFVFSLLAVFLHLTTVYAKPVSEGSVRIVDNQLQVKVNDEYERFFIKGVDYAPYPIGTFPSEWGLCRYLGQRNNEPQFECSANHRISDIYGNRARLEEDFALLEEMNVNTIRTWGQVTEELLDVAEEHGIRVIAGFWVGYEADFSNAVTRQGFINGFRAYVRTFKDHPAILFWAIGNENNYHLRNGQQALWYALVNDMAEAAYGAERVGNSPRYHPVAVVNGEVMHMGDENIGTDDESLDYLDIWGMNVYRDSLFQNQAGVSLFTEYTQLSSKPLWIAEFGADAWHTRNQQNPGDGYEAQAKQARWVGQLWDRLLRYQDVTIGGTVMSYADEYWKNDGEWNSSCVEQDFGGQALGAPDGFANEEWWGIMSVSNEVIQNFDYENELLNVNEIAATLDDRRPRQVYAALQNRFECVDTGNFFYAGPDNGQSCDGTDACCPNQLQKSRNGRCVNRCPPLPKRVNVNRVE